MATYGEDLVRVDFNASGLDTVTACKKDFARLIDLVRAIEEGGGNDYCARHKALAVTHLETAAMFAVKALTGSTEGGLGMAEAKEMAGKPMEEVRGGANQCWRPGCKRKNLLPISHYCGQHQPGNGA